jgi:hypothetical protein
MSGSVADRHANRRISLITQAQVTYLLEAFLLVLELILESILLAFLVALG